MSSIENLDVDRVRNQDLDHVWHPMMQHQGMTKDDLLMIVSGDGCEVMDADGKTYLDACAGIWNVNVGYGRQEIIDAVTRQMQELAFYPQTQISVPAAQLAARLAELLPGDLNHLFFVNSGSEANETAIKVARQYGRATHPGENRYKIICRYQGYHDGRDVCDGTDGTAIAIRAPGPRIRSRRAPEWEGTRPGGDRPCNRARGP